MLKKLFILVLILVAAVGCGIFYLDSGAKSAIEKGGTYATGVETRVADVKIGILGGTFGITNLTMANPPGYGEKPFFALDKLSTGISLPSLKGDLVEIPKLEIDGVRVDLGFKDGKANYAVITDHLKRFSNSAPASEEKGGKKFVIRELTVKNVSVTADTRLLVPLPIGAKPEIVVPELRLKDVGTGGGSNGASLAELAGVIVASVLNAVGGAGNFLNADFAKDLVGRMGDLGSLQQEALGALNKAVGGAANQLLEEGSKKLTDQIGSQLGGLLGGKKK